MTNPEHQHIITVLHSEEAATLSIAMICLLEFTKELAAKSSEGQGMSYEQESNVIGEAVKLLEGMFSQVVAVKPDIV